MIYVKRIKRKLRVAFTILIYKDTFDTINVKSIFSSSSFLVYCTLTICKSAKCVFDSMPAVNGTESWLSHFKYEKTEVKLLF
jgi:hypothetical protein